MRSKKVPENQRIIIEPTHVLTRQSTDILAIEDPEIVKALKFIREKAAQNIQVTDVVAATTLCRSALYERFSKTIGSSISSEIRRVRLKLVKDILRDTDLTVSEIAYKLNFDSPSTVWRYFGKNTGMTPNEYRRKYRLLIESNVKHNFLLGIDISSTINKAGSHNNLLAKNSTIGQEQI
jgi:LacI family transcriptional regulator